MVGIPRRLTSYKGGPKVKLTVFWLDGQREVLEGISLGDALMNAGYGFRSVEEIAFASNGIDTRWKWNSIGEVWVFNKPTV